VATLDLELEATRRDLTVIHIGFARDELRLVLAADRPKEPLVVLQLTGVHSFFDRGAVGCGPILVRVTEPGSFGWHLSDEDRARHREVHINPKSEPIRNIFRAIVRGVAARIGDAEDANFPG